MVQKLRVLVSCAGYNVVRLNGFVSTLLKDWLFKSFPDRATKVWNLVSTLHGGKVNDSDWGRRMKEDGNLAESARQMMTVSKKRFMKGKSLPNLDLNFFRKGESYNLFE